MSASTAAVTDHGVASWVADLSPARQRHTTPAATETSLTETDTGEPSDTITSDHDHASSEVATLAELGFDLDAIAAELGTTGDAGFEPALTRLLDSFGAAR